MISYLCKVAGVSRSGYYKYFSSESKDLRKSREDKDILSKENVLKAFNFKGRKKGARQIKMVLKDRFNIIYNLKRIRRIMKKYGIVCPYRKANPYFPDFFFFPENIIGYPYRQADIRNPLCYLLITK